MINEQVENISLELSLCLRIVIYLIQKEENDNKCQKGHKREKNK